MKNHAKTYPSQVQALASQVLAAVSGSSTSDSFASFDPATWSLRTSGRSEAEGSTSSSVALPKAGMTRSGSLYALPTLARLTDGSESSSSRGGATWDRGEYPTPTATPYGSSQNGASSGHVRPTNGTPSLSTWARDSWATPTASMATPQDMVQAMFAGNDPRRPKYADAWATPTARDWKSGQVSEATHERNARPLSEQVARAWATPTRSDGTGGPGGNREGGANLRTAVSLWPTATATDASSSSKTNKAGETYGNAHTGTTLFDAVRTFTSGRPDRMTDPRGPTISDDSLDGLPLFEAGGSIPSSSSR